MILDDKTVYTLPCQCINCGSIYLSNLKFVGMFIKHGFDQDGIKIPFKDINKGYFFCPTCQTPNQTKPELLDMLEFSIQAFKNLRIEDLIQLQSKLTNAISRPNEIDKLEEAKEHLLKATPGIRSFKDALPKTTEQLYEFLGLIITALAIIVPLMLSGGEEKVTVNQIIINYPKTEKLVETPKPPKQIKIGRNEKCLCGSGKKFKHCHGR